MVLTKYNKRQNKFFLILYSSLIPIMTFVTHSISVHYNHRTPQYIFSAQAHYLLNTATQNNNRMMLNQHTRKQTNTQQNIKQFTKSDHII